MTSFAPPEAVPARRASVAARTRGAAAEHDRVLALQRSAGNRAVAKLMRQPATTEEARDAPLAIPGLGRIPIDPSCLPRSVSIARSEQVGNNRDLRRVTLSDGSLYLVRRKRRLIVSERLEPMRVRASTGSDEDRVWVRIDWCDGSRGDIRIGANPQQALRGIPQTIATAISNGGGPREVLDAVADTSITPFVSVDIARSGDWQVTGQIEVTLNRAGLQGATTAAEVKIGRFRIGGNLTLDREGNPTGGGITLGGDTAPTFDCRRQHRVYVTQRTEFDWMPWIPPSQVPDTRPVQRMRPGDHYVYFPHDSSAIDESRSGRAAFLDVMRQGSRVTSVTGFTSPEGTREGHHGWQGNTRLAQARGDAALAWARSAASEAGAGSVAVDQADVGGELYSPEDPRRGVESSGRPLEQHVLEEFPDDPREQRHQPSAEESRRARTRQQRAELAYTRLRRAVISFERPVVEQESYMRDVPGRFSEARDLCNPVRDADTAAEFPRLIL